MGHINAQFKDPFQLDGFPRRGKSWDGRSRKLIRLRYGNPVVKSKRRKGQRSSCKCENASTVPREMETMDYAFSVKVMKLIERQALVDATGWVLHRAVPPGPCLEWPCA